MERSLVGLMILLVLFVFLVLFLVFFLSFCGLLENLEIIGGIPSW